MCDKIKDRWKKFGNKIKGNKNSEVNGIEILKEKVSQLKPSRTQHEAAYKGFQLNPGWHKLGDSREKKKNVEVG